MEKTRKVAVVAIEIRAEELSSNGWWNLTDPILWDEDDPLVITEEEYESKYGSPEAVLQECMQYITQDYIDAMEEQFARGDMTGDERYTCAVYRWDPAEDADLDPDDPSEWMDAQHFLDDDWDYVSNHMPHDLLDEYRDRVIEDLKDKISSEYGETAGKEIIAEMIDGSTALRDNIEYEETEADDLFEWLEEDMEEILERISDQITEEYGKDDVIERYVQVDDYGNPDCDSSCRRCWVCPDRHVCDYIDWIIDAEAENLTEQIDSGALEMCDAPAWYKVWRKERDE